MRRREFMLALTAAMPLIKSVPTAAAVKRVAFFGFELINTSIESTRTEEVRRIHMLDESFTHKLSNSGRFDIPPIPDDLRDRIAAGPGIANCNGCQRDYAQKLDADLAAWGTVQKVSNPILNKSLRRRRTLRRIEVRQERGYSGQYRRILEARPRLHPAQLLLQFFLKLMRGREEVRAHPHRAARGIGTLA